MSKEQAQNEEGRAFGDAATAHHGPRVQPRRDQLLHQHQRVPLGLQQEVLLRHQLHVVSERRADAPTAVLLAHFGLDHL